MEKPVRITLREVKLEYPLRVRRRGRRPGVTPRRADVGSDIVQRGHGWSAVQALQGISLDVSEGDRLGILGVNGAGKTSLLRVMAGILSPSSGSREVQGKINAIFSLRLGMEADRTGYENIMLRGLLEGRSRREMLACSDEIAEYSGLGDYLDLPIRTYSQGMLARLAFSIGTSGYAPSLLMDEWVNAGDKNFLEMAERRLTTQVEKVRLLVLSSHNQNIVRRLCNRACVLSRGRVAFVGGVEDALAFFNEEKCKQEPVYPA